MKTTKKAFLGTTLAIAAICTFCLANNKGDNSTSFSIIENSAKAVLSAESGGRECVDGKGTCVKDGKIHSDMYLK